MLALLVVTGPIKDEEASVVLGIPPEMETTLDVVTVVVLVMDVVIPGVDIAFDDTVKEVVVGELRVSTELAGTTGANADEVIIPVISIGFASFFKKKKI